MVEDGAFPHNVKRTEGFRTKQLSDFKKTTDQRQMKPLPIMPCAYSVLIWGCSGLGSTCVHKKSSAESDFTE